MRVSNIGSAARAVRVPGGGRAAPGATVRSRAVLRFLAVPGAMVLLASCASTETVGSLATGPAGPVAIQSIDRCLESDLACRDEHGVDLLAASILGEPTGGGPGRDVDGGEGTPVGGPAESSGGDTTGGDTTGGDTTGGDTTGGDTTGGDTTGGDTTGGDTTGGDTTGGHDTGGPGGGHVDAGRGNGSETGPSGESDPGNSGGHNEGGD